MKDICALPMLREAALIDELRRFQWGIQAGGSWKAYKHLTVHADLTWGLNDIFKKDFNTISFAMYPIYLNFGFGYEF